MPIVHPFVLPRLHPIAGACLLALSTTAALAQEAAPAAAAPASAASAASPPAATLQRVEVTALHQRLDAARNGLSPDTGSNVYRFDPRDIAALPLGDATPLNQVLVRAPGVVQDSYGQLHVRGDHANLQYRINGVVIPEAISGFGQTLDTRFADQISLLTGALPAQYGYRTAGVVDIHTKGADLDDGGSVEAIVGSRGHRETSANIGGTAGNLQYFVTGSYLGNDIGIENPTPERDALHDRTRQGKGFAYLSYLLDNDSRVNLMLGSANNRFQIPNVPGQDPAFAIDGVATPDSSALNANQREKNTFAVLSYQASVGGGLDYQVSLFRRNTRVDYQPDPVGDLAYNGVAASIARTNVASGLQVDLSQQLGNEHTLRFGVFGQHERGTTSNSSSVFPADDDGNQTSGVPITIADNATLRGNLFGIYLQDEWKPTKALTVNVGARYDHVDTVSKEQQLSPRVGAVYELSDATRVHAGYARYFTPPPTEKIDSTSVAAFLGTTNALPSDANTSVRSERSNYFDLGISHALTAEWTLGADAYYRQVKHLQDEGQFGNALIYSAFNFDKGRIGGLELSATYRGSQLTGYTNVTISSAKGKGIETGQFNFDDDELAYTQSHWVHLDHDQTLAASAGLSWRFGDGTSIDGDVIYGSGLRNGFANTEHLPSYTQVNAAVARTFDLGGDFGKFDARVSVLNLFDRIYQLRDGSGIGVGAPQYGPRRTVYLALSKPFTF